MIMNNKNNDFNEGEISRLRNAVLKWIDAKNNEKKETKKIPAEKKFILKTKPEEKNKKVGLAVNNDRLNKPKKIFYIKIFFFILSVIISLFILLTFCLYYFNWQDKFTKKITAIIPYPIALVNFKPIYYQEWQKETETLMSLYDRQKLENNKLETPSLKETKIHVLERLINKEFINQLAKKYNISVSNQEIKEYTEIMAEEIGSIDSLSQQLKQLYNWSIEEFENEIVKSIITKSKIGIAINSDEQINIEAIKKINEIEDKIKTGQTTFESLAEQYSEDVTAVQGGDIGYFGKGQMLPEFEQAAFRLEIGEISGIVKTKLGFHIIKLEEKLKDENGEITQIRARHILIRGKDINNYLEEIKKSAKIWRFLFL